MSKKKLRTCVPEEMEKPIENLCPLVTDKYGLRTSYAKRNNQYIYQSIHPADLQSFEQDGWMIHKEGTQKVRIKKLKTHDVLLEDQAWCLFYRMGYPELNDKGCKIKYKWPDGRSGEKQVDIFAKDEETVIIAECKSRETRGRRSLLKDLHETDSLQGMLANAVVEHYGGDYKPKIIWLYITNNIIWSESDINRAAAINVRIITENEFQYFDSFIKYVGPAGRFQFLAEFLQGQEIPELTDKKVPATRGYLGGHKFYSFVTNPKHLLKIAFVNHQALNHPDGRPAYQRMITASRIKDIGNFIASGGYFPTNLLINFIEECRFDKISNKENSDPNIKFGWLYLPSKYKSAWIIDGQHRLYGYSHLDEKYWSQSLTVIAFEKIDTRTEADLFSTINSKQKTVPQSIILSLKSDLKIDSTIPRDKLEALSSKLVKTMNSDSEGPFFQRFSLPGVIARNNQSLTIPEIVKGIVKSGLIGRQVHKILAPGPLSGATDDATIDRARRVLTEYFNSIKSSNPYRWEAASEGHISTNPSIRAQFMLLAEILNHLNYKKIIDPPVADENTLLTHIKKYLPPIFEYLKSASDSEMQRNFSRKFGEGGILECQDVLYELIHNALPDFGPEDFMKRLEKRSDTRIKDTHQDVIQLAQDISDYVFRVLKQHYGTSECRSGEKAYWEKGIENPKIKETAYNRQLAVQPAEKRLPKEAYVDTIDFMNIVKQKNNWPLFSDVFSIPLPGERGGKTYYIDWMDKFNALRRIPAHPSGARGYDEEDYEFMSFIKREFYERLNKKLGK